MKDQKSPFLMAGCKVADGFGTMLVSDCILPPYSLLIFLFCSENYMFLKEKRLGLICIV